MRPVVFSKLLLLSGLMLSTACDVQPAALQPDFHWQESVRDLGDALLGSCTFQSTAYTVGGLRESGAVYRWGSRRWVERATNLQGKRLWACWAGPAQVVYAVGEKGTIFRHNAEGWHKDSVPESASSATLRAVWGLPDGKAVAVGGGLTGSTDTSVILHFDGQEWTRADTSLIATKELHGVWASGADAIWAVGDNGTIARYDGETWQPSNSQVNDRLYALHGTQATEIYAVGGTGRGLVLRWNGSSWVRLVEPIESLRTVWTTRTGSLYVGGDNGFVARYDRVDGLPSPQREQAASPFPHLRVHSLSALGSAILGAAATMQTGENGDWSGAVISHHGSFAGAIFENAAPDAGIPDASMDAGSDSDETIPLDASGR